MGGPVMTTMLALAPVIKLQYDSCPAQQDSEQQNTTPHIVVTCTHHKLWHAQGAAAARLKATGSSACNERQRVLQSRQEQELCIGLEIRSVCPLTAAAA